MTRSGVGLPIERAYQRPSTQKRRRMETAYGFGAVAARDGGLRIAAGVVGGRGGRKESERERGEDGEARKHC